MLANDGPIAMAVGSKVISGVVPINTSLPAISISQISGKEFETIRRVGVQHVTERVQVSVLALTYAQQKQILDLVRSAITSIRGTVNMFEVDSISHDMDGPDLYYEEPVTYEQSIDFIVRYYR